MGLFEEEIKLKQILLLPEKKTTGKGVNISKNEQYDKTMGGGVEMRKNGEFFKPQIQRNNENWARINKIKKEKQNRKGFFLL